MLAMSCSFFLKGIAQVCPPNIDFETGSFAGWTCYTGTTAEVNQTNMITLSPSGPVQGRHTMYTKNAASEVDPYGGFPVNCPNGSGHSIRLGNDVAGTEAEGVAYEFTIPANRNVYSLIYHYAVVFQDPSHQHFQQPRMEIEITNVTDNQVISCSSFSFFPVGSPLPGFFPSSNSTSNTPVWCKDWSAVSINLDGHAGKTIRLFFKTADCTFRRHFGYAYIDVNTECSGEFTGATFCPGDSAVQVVAPHGYQSYTWFSNGFSQVVGKEQTLLLTPAPPAGTTLAVEVVPYHGYGCIDTLYARMIDTLTVEAIAGEDKRLCFGKPEQLGAPPKPGVHYSWSPSAGLTNAFVSNPFANPEMTTNYILTSRSFGGGCVARDSVIITPITIDRTIRLEGSEAYCMGNDDSSVLQLASGSLDKITWYRDNKVVDNFNKERFYVNQSGTYYAQLNRDGCTINTDAKTILIEKAKPPIRYHDLYVVANTPSTLEARTFAATVLWQPGTFLNAMTTASPVFTGSSDQLYTIQLKTAVGCITVDTQAVIIVKHMDILVPTAFTPNKDGRNDILRPVLFGMKELTYFNVYNRWGQLLFQSKNRNAGWDGTFQGKIQANQVVVWTAEGIGMDGKKYIRKGTSVCIQ